MAKTIVIYLVICRQIELEGGNQFVYYGYVGLDACLSFSRWDFDCEID